MLTKACQGCSRQSVVTAVATIILVVFCSLAARAQTLTTGAITGSVVDPTGAVVPNATVTANNLETGATRTTTSGSNGSYNFGQLSPGQYRVSVKVAGFRTQEQGPVSVAVSQTANVNFELEVGRATETVQVTSEAPLIQTDNPNTTANVNAQAIANLPNPGMDLTYVAQIAPGATMNTSGGYGNVEFNGLPAESNGFTIDGLDANDPFLALNNSGATNLQLGLNDVQEATVNTLSYSVDQGRSGAAQINYISKRGTNDWHGNAYEIWNGSRMNAADFFLNAVPDSGNKPFSNVNQFGGSVGGPILRNKLFFFYDLEGTRIVLPTTQTAHLPSPAFEQYTLSQLPKGGFDPINSKTFAPAANVAPELDYYRKAFALYGNPGGAPEVTLGCPILADGTIVPLMPGAPAPRGTGCRLKRVFGISNKTDDTLWNLRIDHDINTANRVWYKFTRETGVQATYTDPINPVFNAFSNQPQVTLAVGYTHIFSPTLVNEFNPGFYWYSAIFQPNDLNAALAASPFQFAGGGFTSIFGASGSWPQGRNVTNWQVIDNLTWTRGPHQFKFGGNLRRTLISDHDLGTQSIPFTSADDIVEWSLGIAGTARTAFPVSTDEPLGFTNLDLYGMDTWKLRRNLTLTAGVRATWNSNPVSQHNHFARLTGDFFSISHDVNQPLNQVIKTGLSQMLPETQLIVWQPRASLAWELRPNTVVRMGGGVFSDVVPYVLADAALSNFPNKNTFLSGVRNPSIPAIYAIPGAGNDVFAAIQAANQALVSGFGSGAPSCSVPNPPLSCIRQASFTAFPTGRLPYPYFLEWSAAVEHQWGTGWAVEARYVGTKSTQIPYRYQANGYQTICQGCFAPFPFNQRLDSRFGSVNQWTAGGNGNYNGLQLSAKKRMSRGLQFQLNYAWSHCLDELSNGGRFTFDDTSQIHPIPGQLFRQYGNCDYDVRHSFNASYVYQLPFHVRNRYLSKLTNEWQVSGDVFLHTGFPFTALSAGYGASGHSIVNVDSAQFATPIPGASPYSRLTPIPGVTVTPGEVQWLNPNAFTSVVNPDTGDCLGGTSPQNCQFGTAGRNTLFAPAFHWTDLFITKRFKITERVAFRVDGQFYNLFNHPNFGLPGTTYGVPTIPDTLQDVGTITGTAIPPTGLLGSGLGGDISVRMIALSARIEF